MPPRYQLRIKDRSGATQAIITSGNGLLEFNYSKAVNEPGLLRFMLPGDHEAIDALELDGQVEMWRADPDAGIDWYADFFGLYRESERRHPGQTKIGKFVAFCPGQMSFLDRAIVAYKASTSDRSNFSSEAGETVLKTLVTRNATSSGTTGDGRVRDVDTWGGNISVEADGAGGSTISFACAYRNLLTALFEAAELADLDYDLVKTGSQAWEFRTYSLLGTDRSDTVVFALNFDNMADVVLKDNRLSEATVAIVGGQGTDASRDVVSRTGANYDALFNSREVFVQGNQYGTTAGLNNAGDARLDELEARNDLSFQVLQTEAFRYGRDYFLGDLVTGRYQNVVATKKIDKVAVSGAPTQRGLPEQIRVELAAP